MKQDFVVYRGEKYISGEKIDILWYTCGYRNPRVHVGTFIDCDEEKDEYRVEVDGEIYTFNNVCFGKTLLDKSRPKVTENSNTPKKPTFKDEMNIDGMFIAWMWYVFIMAIGTIFKDNIAIWILTSIVFFNYRNRKLKEAGYR